MFAGAMNRRKAEKQTPAPRPAVSPALAARIRTAVQEEMIKTGVSASFSAARLAQHPAAKVSAGQHILTADMRGTDAWQDLNARALAQIGLRVRQ
jgi:hypothetical protein